MWLHADKPYHVSDVTAADKTLTNDFMKRGEKIHLLLSLRFLSRVWTCAGNISIPFLRF